VIVGLMTLACRSTRRRTAPIAVAAPAAHSPSPSSAVDPLLSQEAGRMAVEDQQRAARAMKPSSPKADRRERPVRPPLRRP